MTYIIKDINMSAAATLSIFCCLRYWLIPHARGRAGFLLTSPAFGNWLIQFCCWWIKNSAV